MDLHTEGVPRMKARTPSYTTREPRAHVAPCIRVIQALRIAQRFGNKRPTIQGLRESFGMSRATAYRWRAAWDYVREAT